MAGRPRFKSIADALADLSALESSGDGIHSSEEVESQILDGLTAYRGTSPPIDSATNDGPNLLHRRGGRGEDLPSFDGLRHGGRTHDVNNELIAEEYRRDLRITKFWCSLCDELGFILDDF